jgi:hypothetical protein
MSDYLKEVKIRVALHRAAQYRSFAKQDERLGLSSDIYNRMADRQLRRAKELGAKA